MARRILASVAVGLLGAAVAVLVGSLLAACGPNV